jgi:hypothetical protein
MYSVKDVTHIAEKLFVNEEEMKWLSPQTPLTTQNIQ